jgi:hypothetical protein
LGLDATYRAFPLKLVGPESFPATCTSVKPLNRVHRLRWEPRPRLGWRLVDLSWPAGPRPQTDRRRAVEPPGLHTCAPPVVSNLPGRFLPNEESTGFGVRHDLLPFDFAVRQRASVHASKIAFADSQKALRTCAAIDAISGRFAHKVTKDEDMNIHPGIRKIFSSLKQSKQYRLF